MQDKLKKRKTGSHKGENGRVLAVGGSIDYAGAIILAGMSAYRTGVDQVVIAAPEKIALALNAWPDFITLKFKGSYFKKKDAEKIVRMCGNYDVMLIGNGLAQRAETMRFSREAIKKCKIKKVIDADAIKSIRLQDAENSIITPHQREFEILLKNSGINESSLSRKISAARKIIGSNAILLKGKTDVIFSKDKIEYNETGNSGMTVGGTGDVLAGVCAGLAAQKNGLFESARFAAYINGQAGDLLFKEYGYGFTATDLADKISFILKKWQ